MVVLFEACNPPFRCCFRPKSRRLEGAVVLVDFVNRHGGGGGGDRESNQVC